MSDVLRLSSRIYAQLLNFYPEDLRCGHGAEMALVFDEDLAAAQRDHGMRGVLRVWRWTAGEFLRLALPGWICSPAVRVPVMSIALSAGMMLAMLPGILPNGPGRPPNPRAVLYGLRFALMLPLFSTPFICAASFLAGRGAGLVSLRDAIEAADGYDDLPQERLI